MSQTQEQWFKKLNGYFIAFCRKTFRWSPAYRDVIKGAEEGTKENLKYRCASCRILVERSQKQVDHKEPVVPIGSVWDRDWNKYRDRLFVDSSKLQVLCKKCHKEKTSKENKKRKQCKTQ